jgi:hypothetical protein
MQKGVVGEGLEIYTTDGSPLVPWNNHSYPAAGQPLTWFRTTFTLKSIPNDALALNLSGMNRGHAYVNG